MLVSPADSILARNPYKNTLGESERGAKRIRALIRDAYPMSGELSSLCGGLPPELCEQLAREQQVIKIRLERRKHRREVTIIEGLDEKEIDLKKLASELKSRLATGGTYKNGHIELQGDHRHRVKQILIEMGFPEENIIIVE